MEDTRYFSKKGAGFADVTKHIRFFSFRIFYNGAQLSNKKLPNTATKPHPEKQPSRLSSFEKEKPRFFRALCLLLISYVLYFGLLASSTSLVAPPLCTRRATTGLQGQSASQPNAFELPAIFMNDFLLDDVKKRK